MTQKKILIGLALLIGVLIYIRQVELPRQEAELTKDNLFKDIEAEELQSVSINYKNSNFTLINRNPHAPKKVDPADAVEDSNDLITGKRTDSSEWRLSDLPDATLDAGRVNGVVSALTSLSSESSIPEKEIEADLSLYGLANPELVVEFSAKDKKSKVLIGSQNEYVGKRYAKIEGQPELYLITNDLFDAATKPKSEFRDKSPIGFSDDAVTAIEIKSAQDTIEIVPHEEHPNNKKGWKITKPRVARASSLAIYDLFRNLRNLQAQEFVDAPNPDLKAYGLDTPVVSVTLKRKEGGDLITEVGKAHDKEYFQVNRQGTIYQANGSPLTSLSHDLNVYREKMPFKFDNFFAEEITIERPNSPTLVLNKKDEKWTVNGELADQPFVQEYVKSVSDVKAVGFPTEQIDFGFDKPQLKITVKSTQDGKTSSHTLLVGNQTSKGVFAGVDSLEEPFIIGGDGFKSIDAYEERLLPSKNAAEDNEQKSAGNEANAGNELSEPVQQDGSSQPDGSNKPNESNQPNELNEAD